MKYPFKEETINENVKLRLFESTVSQSELIWHRDRNDRLVEVVSGAGWKIQFDNEFPVDLLEGDIISINANEYHRLFKGKTDLKLKITEAKKTDQNKDGKNDFDDVKIARMKASGMSSDEIKKKHPELFEDSDITEKKKKLSDKINPEYLTGKKTRGSKSNREMEREIKKCAKEPRPKSCYDEWDADKTYKKKKKESVETDEDLIREYISLMLEKDLSKSTIAKINKIADQRGMTRGSTKAEYKKGLAAWLTGHRQGVSQHQWATARIKKANPSDSWSVIKKSKSKKKKK